MTDFWPAEIKETPGLVPPLTLLKEAGGDLSEKTSGILKGVVETSAIAGDYAFEHIFFIVAPALDNYRYEVLRVLHGVALYPARIIRRHQLNSYAPVVLEDVQSAEALGLALRTAFGEPVIRQAVGALLAQSKAA